MDGLCYLVNHVTRSVFVPVQKVAHSAIGRSLKCASTYLADKDSARKHIKYTWIMVIREPMDRFNSFYRASSPTKKRLHPDHIMEDIMFGRWAVDVHTMPHVCFVDSLKKPDIIIQYPNLERDWEILQRHFPGCRDLEKINVSPTERDIYRDFRPDQLDIIKQFYVRDYQTFNFGESK